MSSINASDIKTFMVNRATSPEPGVIRQGSYKYGLLNASKAPKQDPKSDKFCENLADEYPSLTKVSVFMIFWNISYVIFLLFYYSTIFTLYWT